MSSCLYGPSSSPRLVRLGAEWAGWVFKHAHQHQLKAMAGPVLSRLLAAVGLQEGADAGGSDPVQVRQALSAQQNGSTVIISGPAMVVCQAFTAHTHGGAKLVPVILPIGCAYMCMLNLCHAGDAGKSTQACRRTADTLLEAVVLTYMLKHSLATALFTYTCLCSSSIHPRPTCCAVGRLTVLVLQVVV